MSFFDDDLFEHLRPSVTAEYPLGGVHIPPDSEEPVTLTLEFAGKGSAYWNAIVKAKPLEDEQAATERAAVLFAKHAVKGWKHVSKDGTPVPFSPEVCGEVFVKLIRKQRGEKVERAVTYALNPDNFRAPMVKAADLGKR